MTITFLQVLGFEGGLLILAGLVWLIYEINIHHPEPFQPKTFNPKLSIPQVSATSWLGKLKEDFEFIYKEREPEVYRSPDGNTLYLSMKTTAHWQPEQVVLFLLSHKDEFITQLKANDPEIFDAFNSLVKNVDIAKVAITFQNMHLLPTFTKDVAVWKVPLIDVPGGEVAKDIIVKELPTNS